MRNALLICIGCLMTVTVINFYQIDSGLDRCDRLMAKIRQNAAVMEQDLRVLEMSVYGVNTD